MNGYNASICLSKFWCEFSRIYRQHRADYNVEARCNVLDMPENTMTEWDGNLSTIGRRRSGDMVDGEITVNAGFNPMRSPRATVNGKLPTSPYATDRADIPVSHCSKKFEIVGKEWVHQPVVIQSRQFKLCMWVQFLFTYDMSSYRRRSELNALSVVDHHLTVHLLQGSLAFLERLSAHRCISICICTSVTLIWKLSHQHQKDTAWRDILYQVFSVHDVAS